MNITYSHEFISNRVTDELILHSISNYREVEEYIIRDMSNLTGYNIGKSRIVNSLSGGQRAILYLITLSYIIDSYKIKKFHLQLNRILESLTMENRENIQSYLLNRGITIEVINDN